MADQVVEDIASIELLSLDQEDQREFVASVLLRADMAKPVIEGGGPLTAAQETLSDFAGLIKSYDQKSRDGGWANAPTERVFQQLNPEDVALVEGLAARMVVGLMASMGDINKSLIGSEELLKKKAIVKDYVARLFGTQSEGVGFERPANMTGYDMDKFKSFTSTINAGVALYKSVKPPVSSETGSFSLKGESAFDPLSDNASYTDTKPFHVAKPRRLVFFEFVNEVANKMGFLMPKGV